MSERDTGLVIGRKGERAVLAGFLEGMAIHPSALIVEGEAGIGKTTIVRAAQTAARTNGLRVVAARPTSGEMELPYAGLVDLFELVSDDALASLAAVQRRALERALGRGAGESIDAHALARGVLGLLRGLAAGGDLLLVVDDVQWLDRPTVAALAFAIRRIDATPLRVLVAVRASNRAATDALGLAGWADVQRLVVGPLSATELGAVVRLHLGGQLARPRLEALHRAAGGNTLFALELAKQAGRSDAQTLSAALFARIESLNAPAREAVSCVAASLRPTTAMLQRAGIASDQLVSALAAGVLQVDGERLRFAHPLLAEAAYALLTAEERRTIHARLSVVATDPVERGHHVAGAAEPPDEAAADTLEQTAVTAAGLADHVGAAAFLLRAAGLSADPGGGAWARRTLGAADELIRAGDVASAVALLRELVERLPAGRVRAAARLALVRQPDSVRPYDEELQELSRVLEEATRDDALTSEAYRTLAELACAVCRLDDALDWASRAIECAARVGEERSRVYALSVAGYIESAMGRGVSARSREAVRRWDQSYVFPDTFTPGLSLGTVLLFAGQFEESESLIRAELALAEEGGLEPLEVMARAMLAEVQIRAGSWAEALENAMLAAEHARQASNARAVMGSSYALALAQAMIGQVESARALSEQMLSQGEAMGDVWFVLSHRAVLGHIALAMDDPLRATRVLQPAWALLTDRRIGNPSIFPIANVLGEALAVAGEVDDSYTVINVLETCAAADLPWCRAIAARTRAVGESISGDHAAALRSIGAALEAHRHFEEPFEQARTLQIAGRIHRSARNWGAARAVLVEALDRFDQLGAARWSERAAADIAGLPGRRPAGTHELTPREEQVAQLVALGLSNSEVAARLYVSRRTVEATLSRVYAKLGLHTRTELAARHAGDALAAPADSSGP